MNICADIRRKCVIRGMVHLRFSDSVPYKFTFYLLTFYLLTYNMLTEFSFETRILNKIDMFFQGVQQSWKS